MDKIERCHLFDGEPYTAEKDGKYHVLQGSLTDDDVRKWYDTENEAVKAWNERVKAAYGYEKSRMGIVRDVQSDCEDMKRLLTSERYRIDLNPQTIITYDENWTPRYGFGGFKPKIVVD